MKSNIDKSSNLDSILSGQDTFLKDDSGYENKDEKIEVLRKKLKILKAALIKERQAKGLTDQEVSEFKRKNQLLQAELDEKEKTMLKLHKEIDELQEKLITERMNIEKYKKLGGNFQSNPSLLTSMPGGQRTTKDEGGLLNSMASFFTFGAGGQKVDERPPNLISNSNDSQIQVEFAYLKKQHEALLDKFKKSEDSVDAVKRDHKYETDNLMKKLEKIQNDFNEKDNQFRNLTQDYRNSCQANLSLLDEKEKLEREIYNLHAVNEKISHEKYQLNCLIEEKEKTLNELHDLIVKSQQATAEMTEKIALLNQTILDLENKIQIFKLNKIGNVGALTKIPMQMIMRRDLNGIYIIEFESPSDKWVLEAIDVLDLIPSKDKENNKFSLVYLARINQNQKETDTYETEEDAAKICKMIKRFLTSAIEFRKKNPDKTLNVTKKEGKDGKRFLTDIVSFFGN